MPSTRRVSGLGSRAFTARAIASREAFRILNSSIYSRETTPTAVAKASPWITTKASSLALAVIIFESLTPGTSGLGGKITAAATTGPANGPRPASSTPAIK